MNQATLISLALVQNFRVMTTPQEQKPTASHAGNWPASATFAVEYELHDRQFPSVVHEPSVQYFDDAQSILAFLEDKREWIKGTDYDFSMQYSVYEWDLGPELKYSKSM